MKEPKEILAEQSSSVPIQTRTMSPSLWNGLNYSTLVLATSAYITTVQSPIKSLLVNPGGISNYRIGAMSMVKFLYAGTSSSLTGSVLRTTYVTQTKTNKPKENNEKPEAKSSRTLTPGQFVMGAAGIDVALTQVSESLSTLRKIDQRLPASFQWNTPHNLIQLMRGGLMCRYSAGISNFAALCILEDKLIKKITISNEQAKHFIAGGLSGVAAAALAHPFTSMKEHLLQQASVDPQGRLVHQPVKTVLVNLFKQLKDSPKETCSYFLLLSSKQLLLRMIMNSLVFSGISFVNSALGPEPLKGLVPVTLQPPAAPKKPGFFSGCEKQPEQAVIVTAQPTNK